MFNGVYHSQLDVNGVKHTSGISIEKNKVECKGSADEEVQEVEEDMAVEYLGTAL